VKVLDWNNLGGIATRYGMDGPGIESRLGRDFPCPSRPAHPASCRVGTGSLFRCSRGWGVALSTHPHLAPRLKPSLGLHGLFYSEMYLNCETYYLLGCDAVCLVESLGTNTSVALTAFISKVEVWKPCHLLLPFSIFVQFLYSLLTLVPWVWRQQVSVERFVPLYQTTWLHFLEDRNLNKACSGQECICG
jgi:hypothetical protein